MENIQHEYFIWEENSYTEQKKNDKNNNESVHCVTTTTTKNDLTQKDWKDITEPKEWQKAYNKDKRKTYLKEYGKKYWRSNKEKIVVTKKKYYEKNKEIINSKNKLYKINNNDKIKNNNESYKSVRNKRKKERLKCDVNYKLQEILRNRLRNAIKKNKKVGSAVKDLGCSVEELKCYLESKFQLGMSWENHGLYGWHIDHIKPLASFDLMDRKQFLEACHYTNLQPLWAKDNIIKGDKIVTSI